MKNLINNKNNMIFLTGDKHWWYWRSFSVLNSKNFPIQKKLTKNDCVVVLGDFWLIWDNSKEEQYWLKWLTEKPWTTLFVDWNHENFDLLLQYPEVEMFWDKVWKITDSIFHLKRGRVYNIENKNIFTMWWATSVDKLSRMPWISWWPQELPDSSEFRLWYDNLEKYWNKVDYIFSHTCPEIIIDEMFWKGFSDKKDVVSKYFNSINNIVEFKHWYFWHFHENKTLNDKYTVLYEKVIQLS